MGIGTAQQLVSESPVDAGHPICRGDFAALVFSGDAEILGELPGELTAYVPAKFCLPDPELEATSDFARAAGQLLPRWPRPVASPIDGICFVFTNPRHPALLAMIAHGAVRDEHYVLVSGVSADPIAASVGDRLRHLLAEANPAAPADASVVVIAYGHQGREIAMRLRDELGVNPRRIMVHERNPDARAKAVVDGFTTLEENNVIGTAVALGAAVVCSPLMLHDRLARLVEAARERGLPVMDNAQPRSGLRQFHGDGVVRFTAAARRVLVTDGRRIELREPLLAQTVSIIREDLRSIAGREFVHLHAGRVTHLDAEHRTVTVAEGRLTDPLPLETLRAVRRVHVALNDRADHGFFAARELALTLWPAATRSVFAAEHTVDLGGTTLERMLLGFMVAREVASTMQTAAQRATLGIVARHYASDRPIVEIGSAFGGSAMLMAAATDRDRPTIWSIDPDASTRDIMRFAFAREGQADRLRQVIKTSDAAITDLRHLRGACGLVFIDGLHTTAGVRSDFELYAPLVAPGGALLFHDVAMQIETVMRFVLGEAITDPRFALRALVDGLAVFERLDD
jgi:predicted O-methyltransferase YrrM